MKPAYSLLTANDQECQEAAAGAIARVTEARVEQHVRVIATSAPDQRGPNYERVVDGLQCSCTCGAGVNGASVHMRDPHQCGDVMRCAYDSISHGEILKEFHDGPWVEELAAIAERCRKEAGKRDGEVRTRQKREFLACFAPLDAAEEKV